MLTPVISRSFIFPPLRHWSNSTMRTATERQFLVPLLKAPPDRHFFFCAVKSGPGRLFFQAFRFVRVTFFAVRLILFRIAMSSDCAGRLLAFFLFFPKLIFPLPEIPVSFRELKPPQDFHPTGRVLLSSLSARPPCHPPTFLLAMKNCQSPGSRFFFSSPNPPTPLRGPAAGLCATLSSNQSVPFFPLNARETTSPTLLTPPLTIKARPLALGLALSLPFVFNVYNFFFYKFRKSAPSIECAFFLLPFERPKETLETPSPSFYPPIPCPLRSAGIAASQPNRFLPPSYVLTPSRHRYNPPPVLPLFPRFGTLVFY